MWKTGSATPATFILPAMRRAGRCRAPVYQYRIARPTIGASGAIAGVMGAYFFLFPYARVVTLIIVIFFVDVVEIPAFFFLAFWFLLQFYSGTVSFGAQDALSGGVAWWAHIGGFIAGILLLFAFGVRRTARRSWLYR